MVDATIITRASRLESRIHYRFRDKQLLYDATVRKGFENEAANALVKNARQHDIEVLANLGDSVIDLLATEHLILEHHMDETSKLTEGRQRMVNRDRLTLLGRRFHLEEHLTMSEGERLDLGRSAMLGEAMESLIGAVYLDGAGRDGLTNARKVLARMGFFTE
ncbi:hypothetical protein AOA80_05660 [Methanomassiliicoccales archaeon RumEn M1]|nr:hypothetical protein AOA80_05660 [Methanomassiliicoccales archaeon RumEn M1]